MSWQDAEISPRLLRAYRTTDYAVGNVAVRVGDRSAASDRLLSHLRGRIGILITAWNPMSLPMPAARNRRMNHRLEQRLRRYSFVPATGRWRRWSEDHLLVIAPLRCIRRIARLFRQRAVVILTQGQPARLIILHPEATVAQISRRSIRRDFRLERARSDGN